MAYDRFRSDAQFGYLAIWESLRQVNYFTPRLARKILTGMELCDTKPQYQCSDRLVELAAAITQELRSEFDRVFGEDIEAVYEEKEKERAERLSYTNYD